MLLGEVQCNAVARGVAPPQQQQLLMWLSRLEATTTRRSEALALALFGAGEEAQRSSGWQATNAVTTR